MAPEVWRSADYNRRLIDDVRTHGGRATLRPFTGREILILTTTGARSGQPRESPLVFSRAGEHYVVLASKGGDPTDPAWYRNLVANPEVGVEVQGRSFRARARVAADDEYERLYKRHADGMPAFWEYRRRTTRKIPVVVLERI
jgi:deazaflavin-dependent oxidoreductase (nitroreductase family)